MIIMKVTFSITVKTRPCETITTLRQPATRKKCGERTKHADGEREAEEGNSRTAYVVEVPGADCMRT